MHTLLNHGALDSDSLPGRKKLQPVAKMLRHVTCKTLFLTKHRIKLHISKVKQLPTPSLIFNVVP